MNVISFLVPILGTNFFDRAKLFTANFAGVATTDNKHRTDYEQTRNDHNEIIQDNHQDRMNLPVLHSTEHSLERSCNMVEISSNPLSLLNQYEPSNKKVVKVIDALCATTTHSQIVETYHYFYRVERDNIVQGMTRIDISCS